MVNSVLFDSLLDGVLIVNEQNQITYVNDSLANLVGLKLRQILKKNFTEIQGLQVVLQEVIENQGSSIEATPYLERTISLQNQEKSLQVSVQRIGSENIFYIRDTSLESVLHQKYKDELSKKEAVISELDRRIFELEFLRSSAELQAGEGFSIQKSFEKVLNLLNVKRVLLYKLDSNFSQNIDVFYDSESAKIPDPDIVKIILKSADKIKNDRLMIIEAHNHILVLGWFLISSTTYNVFIYQYEKQNLIEAKKDQNLLFAHSRQSSLLLENDILFKQSITDEKTGLYNPRYLKFRMEQEIERSRRHSRSFSLIVFDIDHFKLVNDTYGHLAGDIVLIEAAEILKNSFRGIDMVARYGGEEFVVLCAETPPEKISLVAERARESIAKSFFKLENGVNIQITISAGVSSYPGDGSTTTELFEAADKCLYEAKKQGRNRVVLSPALKSL